jgi:hypothetical protein
LGVWSAGVPDALHHGFARDEAVGLVKWSLEVVSFIRKLSAADIEQLIQHVMATVQRVHGVQPWESADRSSQRVWWNDAGVHQNITFPVHPDPISGMHCWHQKVRVERAGHEDRYGDVFIVTVPRWGRAAVTRLFQVTDPA